MVAGSDVYVGGSTWNGYHNIAAYWKNGQIVTLTDGTTDAAITGLAIDGNDVYASGFHSVNTAPQNSGDPIHGYAPVYWKNGVETKLTRLVDSYGYLTGIAIKAHKPY